jgi:14-3-3 protein epsilon
MATSLSRGDLLYVCGHLKSINAYQTIIGLMQNVIRLDPSLNAQERELLLFAYKGLFNHNRDAARVILEELKSDSFPRAECPISKLLDLRTGLIRGINSYCSEMINLIDTKLWPPAPDSLARIFYLKLKADGLRYRCEYADGDEKADLCKEASALYMDAVQMCNDNLPERDPTYLGIILNFAIFLYEIVENKPEALELLQTTFEKMRRPTDVQLNEPGESQCRVLLQLMHDNFTIWSREVAQKEVV